MTNYIDDHHYEDDDVRIAKLEVGTFENNCYLFVDKATGTTLVVDAPFEADVIVDHLEGVAPERIVVTHGHGDHVAVLKELRRRLDVPSGCHEADAEMMPVPPDYLIGHGDVITVGTQTLRAVHTPGHTPGGVCLIWEPEGREPHLFSGDTLFPGGPGNTKQPLGDFELIIDSIERELFTLPDETAVHPGHGLDTTIGTERPQLPEWVARGW